MKFRVLLIALGPWNRGTAHMSDVDTAQQPKTLDDAIKEINSLRSQLSGSDLEVFTQNRELRVENLKLKEDFRQLTEQCVSQTFAVRGLEKSQTRLQEEVAQRDTRVAELESHVTDLEGKIEGLETQVTDLGGQLEVHRSKELDLSQELEKTLAESAATLEKMSAEHQELVQARSAEFDAVKKELEESLSAREETIQALEQRVETFKEEFLSQEIAPSVAASDNGAAAGHAFELLSSKMEDFLGFPGRALVEQVFRLCGVDQQTNSASELEETFEVLQDTASQLVRSPEQEEELAGLLSSAWSEIGLGEGGAPAAPAKPETAPQAEEPAEAEAPAPEPEPEPVAESEESTEPAEPTVEEVAETAPEEAPAEEVAEPAAEEAAEEAAAEPAAEEASSEPEAEAETEAAAEEQAAEESSPEPETAETAAEESQAEEPAPSEEPAAEEAEDAPEPEAQAEPEPAAAEEEEAPAESDTSDFDTAAALLDQSRHEEALPLFEALGAQDAEEPTYQVGRLACLVALGRFEEAQSVGESLAGVELGESKELYDDSMTAVAEALAPEAPEEAEAPEQADAAPPESAAPAEAAEAQSDLVRKEQLLEQILAASDKDQIAAFLDEADEIGLRIAREGELSLLQATHRIAQDDVTEYLLDALHSLSDRPDVFGLLKTNLERYPELGPLTDFLERLLDSPRAESLEAESAVKELLGQGESVEDLLDEVDPGEEAVVQVFLEHLIPRSEVSFDIPSEDFEELMLEAEPAAFVGSLRQALRSVDYTVFFEEIEVLSYDGDDHFLLRSSPEPKPTLLFGPELDDVPPEELRFLVLRELFSMYRRHSNLAHISAGLDDSRRLKLVKACLDIYSEFESAVSQEIQDQLAALTEKAGEDQQDEAFRTELETFLRNVYLQTESDSFLELGDFLYGGQLNRKWLDSIADGFGARQTGIVVASCAICRDLMSEEEFEQLEENGFGWLYSEENLEKYSELRLRLQRLWSTPLKALISDPEE